MGDRPNIYTGAMIKRLDDDTEWKPLIDYTELEAERDTLRDANKQLRKALHEIDSICGGEEAGNIAYAALSGDE